MTVSHVAHSLFASAASVLTTPAAQLSGFSMAGAAPAAKPAAHPGKPLHDGTQAALLALQEATPQAGAFASGLEGVVG
jgi:hypothetical protein